MVTIYKPEIEAINAIVPKKKKHRLDLSYVQVIFEYVKKSKKQNVTIVATDGMRMLVIQKSIEKVFVKDKKDKAIVVSPKMLSVLFDENKCKSTDYGIRTTKASIPIEAFEKMASLIGKPLDYPDWKKIDKDSNVKKHKNVFSFENLHQDVRPLLKAHFKKECGFNISFLNDFSKFVNKIHADKVDFFQKDIRSMAYTTITHDWATYKFYLMPVAVS